MAGAVASTPLNDAMVAVVTRRALELKMEGKSLRSIADSVTAEFNHKISYETVRKYIKEGARAEYSAEAEEYRQLQTLRYEAIISEQVPRMRSGDDKATANLLRAMRDLNDLLGLNAPVRQDVRIEVPVTIDAEVTKLAAELGMVASAAAQLPAAPTP